MNELSTRNSFFAGDAKVMPMRIHVRRADGQGDYSEDRGVPGGTDPRSIRDFALQEEQ